MLVREPDRDSAATAEARTVAWAWLGALLDCPSRPEALRHAMIDLGFSRIELLRGLASQLRLSAHALEHPDASALAGCRRDRVGASIPILLEHPDPHLAEIGRRWLRASGMLYEVDPVHVERWLIAHDDIGRLLAPSLAREGLALLGPSALRRVAEAAPPATRALAADWVARLAT